jgi:hypothetical protein
MNSESRDYDMQQRKAEVYQALEQRLKNAFTVRY